MWVKKNCREFTLEEGKKRKDRVSMEQLVWDPHRKEISGEKNSFDFLLLGGGNERVANVLWSYMEQLLNCQNG